MKRMHIFLIAIAIIMAPVLASCGKSSDGEKSGLSKLVETAENMKTAAEEMSKTMSEEREPVPPVSFNVLINYLPEMVDDMQRNEPRGETSSYGEWHFSTASASYSGDGDRSVNIELSDFAHVNVLYAPYTMLLKMKYSKESTSGYERSMKFGDYPGYESWNKNSRRGELTLLVGDRFLAKISTYNLPDGSTRRIAEGMKLNRLAKERAEPAS